MNTHSELSSYGLFIDEETIPSIADEQFKTVNPATGEGFAPVARAREEVHVSGNVFNHENVVINCDTVSTCC